MQSRNRHNVDAQASFRDILFAILALLTSVALFAPAAAEAQLGSAFERRLEGKLVAETMTPAPGETVTLAFHMTPDKGWHGYWENPGDAGLGMVAHWELPQGVTAGDLQYPVPHTLVISGLMNHVYESDYAVLVPLSIPATAAKGSTIAVKVEATALVCDDKLCVPQDFKLSLDLVVGDGAITPESRAQFDSWRAKLPRPLSVGERDALYMQSNGVMKIGVKLPQTLTLSEPHLFAATTDAIDYAAPQRFYRNGDWLVMETKAGPETGKSVEAIDSLLKIGADSGLKFTAIAGRPGELPETGETIAGAAGDAAAGGFEAKTLLFALGGAILGGLLLNIMPCVFPILSLKALSLARAGGDEAEVRREAWGYAAGVVAVCLALGAVILGLRAAGEEIGWAFQLQNPAMLLILLFLVTAITANLAGLFEITGPSVSTNAEARGGFGNAFLTGALAAIIATPCTGPFMGAALGATLVLPAWAALAIFGGLGVGLALPFVALAYSPALRAKLPKPGPWMERFRRWMAVPMALTALALVWLLWRQAGLAGLVVAAVGAGVTLIIALWYGREQRQGKGGGLFAGAALLSLAVSGAYAFQLWAPKEDSAAELAGTKFSIAALDAARASGKPVFVYFTADWCVTCKVNEGAAINRAETEAAFAEHDVQVLVADWTNGDPEITRVLAEHGRNSVPLYLWYKPGDGIPEILPQILTPSMLTTRAAQQ